MIIGMDSIIPATVLSTASLVSNAISSVKNARDIAKQSQSSDVKDAVSEVYDAVLDLKNRVLDLDEENRSLKKQLDQKAKVARNREFGYYFMEDDPDPLCPKCYESDGKLVHLPASKEWNGGVRRICIECRETFWEKQMVSKPVIRGSNSWMS